MLVDYLGEASREYYDSFKALLDGLGIQYKENRRLVRKHQTSTAQHASAQNSGPEFAPSRSVGEEKNLPPAGFTPQGAIRPMNQEPPRSQHPMGTTTGSGAQNSRFQQGPATGSVPVGGGSGFTNTSQFDVPVPFDLDDSEFEPLV